MFCRPYPLRVFALLGLASLLCASHARASDVEKSLRQQYRGKIFVLRGFYAGDHLQYDSSGKPVGRADSGDWIGDGFVLITDLHVSNLQMIVDGKRLLVVDADSKEFQIQPDAAKFGTKVKIEVDLQSESDADAVLSKIFLGTADSLATLVADYWKPCVREAAKGDPGGQRFSADLMAVPGVAASVSGDVARDSSQEQTVFNCKVRSNFGKGMRTPRVIHQVNPSLPEGARSRRLKGTVFLEFVVDEKGAPQYIRVIKPLGNGFDEQAFAAVQQWVLAPAEKHGVPVPSTLIVEVDFHL